MIVYSIVSNYDDILLSIGHFLITCLITYVNLLDTMMHTKLSVKLTLKRRRLRIRFPLH